MIVPMKKVCLVVQDKYREDSLKKLRSLGVLHLENQNVSSDPLSKLLEKKNKIDNAIGILRPYAIKKKKVKEQTAVYDKKAAPRYRRASDFLTPDGVPFSTEAVDGGRSDLATAVLSYVEKRKNLNDRIAALMKERSRIKEWGDFNPKDFSLLQEKGLKLFLYKIPNTTFAAISKDIEYVFLGYTSNAVYIAVLNNEISGETPFALPDMPLHEIDSLILNCKNELEHIEKLFDSFAGRIPVLDAEIKQLLKEIEFEKAQAAMNVSDALPAESAVSWISGFVPSDTLGQLKRGAAENNWALAIDDPGEDDFVPTKLKNNRFAGLIKPLTGFLDVVPGYNEVDISGWFLFFFLIFFGMIFGDAGYGALFVIIALLGFAKTAKKGVPPILKLLLILGISNFLWGVFTCSWLGIPVKYLPQFLHSISLPPISNVTASLKEGGNEIVQQNLMIFCFTLALLQLSIGHVIALMRLRTLKILAELGSLSMIIGMYGVVLFLIAKVDALPLLPFVYGLGIGFVINFMFANYEGSLTGSVLDSLKNIISVVLNIANVFSDIMSYIRLWAVGLAGAAIANTVNTMAADIAGLTVALQFIIYLMVVVLLVFGHGLNLILNALSVLVHGVRLNTLEFSGHVGLTWAGTAYKPFSEKKD